MDTTSTHTAENQKGQVITTPNSLSLSSTFFSLTITPRLFANLCKKKKKKKKKTITEQNA